MNCMMRVSKIVRVMMEDETMFPFESLTVEPGKSWRKKARAFKSVFDKWKQARIAVDKSLPHFASPRLRFSP